MLHAHRDAHKVVRQSPGRPDFSRDGGVAHVAGQADAAGHTAKADGDLEQLCLLCYDLTGLHATYPTTTDQCENKKSGPAVSVVLDVGTPEHCLPYISMPHVTTHGVSHDEWDSSCQLPDNYLLVCVKSDQKNTADLLYSSYIDHTYNGPVGNRHRGNNPNDSLHSLASLKAEQGAATGGL